MNRTNDDAPLPGRWIAMAALLVAGFMNLMDVTIVNVAIPSLQAAFGANEAQIEWVVAVYILTFALLLLPMGRLGDVYGRRRMFIGGVCVFTLGSALCGLAPSIETLIGARVVQGIGGAMMTPQTLAIVPALFAPKERGMAFALFGLSAGLASVSGPVLGGALIGADLGGLDWRPIFLVNVPVGVIAVLGALRYVPNLPGRKGLEIDFVGIGLAAVTLFLVLFPLIEGRQLNWPAWLFVMLGAALPAAVLFVLWQRRRAASGRAQLLPVTLFANRNYMIGTGLVTLLFAGIPGFFFVLAILLQVGNGLTPLQSGLTTMPFSVGVLIASAVAGRLGNRTPKLRIALGGVMLLVCMSILPVLVPGAGETLSRTALLPALLLGGLWLGTAVSPMFNTVLAQVAEADTGSASGALQAFQQVGGALGLAVMGQLFFGYLARAGADVPAYSTALAHALWFSTVTFALVALLVWRLPKGQRAKLDKAAAA
ncbi:DHA2 family efflux MFS transporter permease subunit [Salipiger sp. IMCC34102]|uniref:DHA2 family efflux MFS transporter permease subunit n=1 Tax=Salipiger sp. IMCC34102 TaxID=2510647 RepID=UPI00101CECB8|nr:DHA2 family efflux MFS transporter permease subunit [Salipiger sp. IMCC34102]RYH02150.1 DHA2 family efflux MFS transporter permease subunit [Salipiger sp. IMCC34102]